MPIFPLWETSTLSTLPAGRAPAPRREARVAAVCGFAPRLRTCARRSRKSLRCANVRASPGAAQRIPAAAGKILPFGRSQHRIWLVAGLPAPCQMLFAGRSPHPLHMNGENMKKDKQFSIRISEQDLETIRRKAAQAHMSQSDYVTACCLENGL